MLIVWPALSVLACRFLVATEARIGALGVAAFLVGVAAGWHSGRGGRPGAVRVWLVAAALLAAGAAGAFGLARLVVRWLPRWFDDGLTAEPVVGPVAAALWVLFAGLAALGWISDRWLAASTRSFEPASDEPRRIARTGRGVEGACGG